MANEAKENKKLSLTAADIGSEIKDVKVKCTKVFCPRRENDFVSFYCDARFTIAGRSKIDVIEGGTYLISGKVKEWNHRIQVDLKTISVVEAVDEVMLIASFLADNIKDLGKVTAESLATKFGRDILKILSDTPEKAAAEVKGLSVSRAIEICDQMIENKDFFRQGLEAKLLGFSQAQINLLSKSGQLDCETIKKAPYDLMGHGIAGFDLLDRIALGEGLSYLSHERVAAAVYQACMAIHEDTRSTALMPQAVKQKTFEYLNNREQKLTSEQFESIYGQGAQTAVSEKNIAIYKFVSGKCVACDCADPEARFASMSYFRSEREIERRINEMLKLNNDPPPRDESDRILKGVAADIGIDPDRSQLDALYLCMYSPISVITGGPGTGKTTIMGILGEYFRRNDISCMFAAPTGRAAKKLSEASGCKASTIHRLLGVRQMVTTDEEDLSPDDRAGQYNSLLFVHGKDNTLDARVIVIDEMSMVDTMLFRHLLDATAKDTSLILVGDPDQLPSVGCGDVLRDLISCNSIPKVRLEALHRQADTGTIAANAGLILNGSDPECIGEDFEIITCKNEEEASETISRLVMEHKGEDLICLTPTKNENAALGTVKLNKMLQSVEAKDDLKIIRKGKDLVLHVGDKVMQNRNDYSAEWTDPLTGDKEQGVFNGELGIISDIDPVEKTVTIDFDEGKIVKYTSKLLENIDLAYAVTVHKSQGCEFDMVIIALGKMNFLLFKRCLLYTAITRGRKHVTIVECESALSKFLRAPKDDVRDTCLRDLLKTIDHRRGNI